MPKKMIGAPMPPTPTIVPLKVKSAPRQGGTSRIKNLGTYAHPPKKKGR